MDGHDRTESPLDRVGGAVGDAAVRAFKRLGNETRLAILLALWEAHEPFGEDGTLSFSELLDRVGYDTSGNFSYHLGKLEGHYVESTADGYRLKRSGHRLVRTVIAGTGIRETTLERTELDLDCWICGTPLAITYEDEHLYTVCEGCGGTFRTDDERPAETVMGFAFDPAGLARPTPEAVFAASVFRAMGKFAMQMGGLCPDCSGPVEASMHVCEDHAEDGACATCGRRYELQARWICTVCKNAGHGPVGGNLVLHPLVRAFYADRGLDIGYPSTDFESIARTLQAMSNHRAELVSTEPVRVRVEVAYDGDELRLLVDESMCVVEVEVEGEA
jgi:DNA-binding transcriptional ArsR family regulator